MDSKYIADWQWDDRNLAYLARRGITRTVVRQVAGGRPLFRRNKSKRSATHLMIGPDDGGKVWTICILAVNPGDGLWRAITGWPSDDKERAWYKRHA